jgi:hypothetical protein
MAVEKCAGNSIVAILRSGIDANEMCPPPLDGTWAWQADEVRGYRLYCGHFTTDFINGMGPGGLKLTMLRHPLSRAVSLYDFWRSYRWDFIRTSLPPVNGPAVAKSLTLSEFLNTSTISLSSIYNTAASQLLGHRFKELRLDEDAAIAEAIAVLRGFDWVGITELFEPSIASLCELLDLAVPTSLPKDNSTYDTSDDPTREPVEPTVATDDERRRILENNRIDMAIYQEARKILEERLQTRAASRPASVR